jgi:hypothetical protein
MDPQTPVVEFWVSELDEFMGAAIEYTGKAGNLLLDTFEFGESLTSALGNVPTFQFVLDSLVKDAVLSGAKNLLVFNCKYGHPLEFVNFVRRSANRGRYKEFIKFDPAFNFELADPDCSALSNSKNGIRAHYTDAFRSANYKRRPMTGRIPVFVIDVNSYYEQIRQTAY